MQTQEQHILPLVQRETERIAQRLPEHADTVRALAAAYAARFREGLGSYQDAFELCRRVEEMLREHDIPPELMDQITSSRSAIFWEIIQHGMNFGSLEGPVPPRFTLQFPPVRNGKKARPVSRERSPQEYERVVREQNFDLLRLASWMGEDAAADVLCALGQIGEEERSRVISFLTVYLGKSAQPEPFEGGGILTYPRAVLEVPSVRAVVRRWLLKKSYELLLERGADDPRQHTCIRRKAGHIALERMTELAKAANVTDPAIHAGLFVEVSDFLQKACTREHPENLVSSLQERGQSCPFPSLRQLIAVEMLRERKRVYVGFEPGRGKTPIPPILMEHLKAEGKHPRMLYLAPLPVIQEIPNRFRPGSAPQQTRDCYYVDPEQAPTVGIVESGLKNGELKRITQENDVVFCPYSMLHSQKDFQGEEEGEDPESRDENRLIDLLCAEQWDILVIDEAHCIDGNRTWTKLVDRLLWGADGKGTKVSREGFAIAMSGTPIVNTMADPVVIHDLFTSPAERERRYGEDVRETEGRDAATELGLNPLRVRQALCETLLILDPPEPWLNKVWMLHYDPSKREMDFIRSFCTPALSFKHKTDVSNMFLPCPRLVSGDDTMPESLIEWVKEQLDSDLKEKNSILIAENMRAQGVLRAATGAHAPDPEELSLHFHTKIEQFCREWSECNGIPVRFGIVHGKVAPADRQRAYVNAEEAQKTGNFKAVNLVMSQCLNLGIRLHVDRIIALEWAWNSPEVQQLLKRALREGESDVRLTACYAKGTVQEGVYLRAMDKYKDALHCQYGAGVSDSILREHARARTRADVPESEDALFHFLNTTSPAERRFAVEHWLHGRGTGNVSQFWDRHREEFHLQHDEADKLGTGDMQRFLGGLILNMGERAQEQTLRVLDCGSDGLSLEREVRRAGGSRVHVTSVDPLVWMLERGRASLYRDDPARRDSPSCTVAGPTEVHRAYQAGELAGTQYDVGILRHLEQCNHVQSDQTVHERARALLSILRTIRTGGRLVIPLSRTSCTSEEFEHFVKETLPLFGCLPVDGWHGAVRSLDNAGDEPFRCFCAVAEKCEDCEEATLRERLKAQHLRFSHHTQWAATAEGVRVTNAMRRTRLPYPLRHRQFKLGNRAFEASDARPEVRKSQEEHLHILEEAVRAIRSIAPLRRDWDGAVSSARDTLKKRGILFSAPLSHTVHRPVFSLRSHPGHLFFPYDPQWNAAEET